MARKKNRIILGRAWNAGRASAVASVLLSKNKTIAKMNNLQSPKISDPGWVGHEWKMRGFYSDICIHCGTVAVDGMNARQKDLEHCSKRAESKSSPAWDAFVKAQIEQTERTGVLPKYVLP